MTIYKLFIVLIEFNTEFIITVQIIRNISMTSIFYILIFNSNQDLKEFFIFLFKLTFCLAQFYYYIASVV
jgi:hypothetical protein